MSVLHFGPPGDGDALLSDSDEDGVPSSKARRANHRVVAEGGALMSDNDEDEQAEDGAPSEQARRVTVKWSAAWYHRELVAYAKRTLDALGAKRGEFVPIGAATAGEDDVRNIWNQPDEFIRTTPAAVLRTNIADQDIIPDRLEAKSTFEDLWRISEMTVDEVAQYPFEGCDVNGQKFHLLVPQLAMIIALSKGPNMSRMSFRSSNAEEIRKSHAERDKLTADIKMYRKAHNEARMRACEREKVFLSKAPKALTYDTVVEPFYDPAAQPSFAWLVSSMGTGKTIMSILTGAAVLRNEWAACKTNFSRWVSSIRRVSPLVPMGMAPSAGEDDEEGVVGKLTRTMMVVSPEAVFGTMAGVLEHNKDILQAYIGVAKLTVWVWTGGSKKEDFKQLILDHTGAQADRKALIVLIPYIQSTLGFSAILKGYSNVGFPVVLMDELAQQTGELACPIGVPLFYRSFGISATPSSLFDMTRTSPKNFVRTIIGSPKHIQNFTHTCVNEVYADALVFRNGHGTPVYDELNTFITRYACSDILLGHRIPMAVESARTMAPYIDIYNFKIKNRLLKNMFRGQWGELSQDIIHSNPSYFAYADFTEAVRRRVDAAAAQENTAVKNNAAAFAAVIERALAKATDGTACVRCGGGFGTPPTKCAFSVCCTAIYCEGCVQDRHGPCVQCGVLKGFPFGGATTTMSGRLKTLQASKALTQRMLSFEVLRAAVEFKRSRVLVFANIASPNQLEDTMSVVEEAARFVDANAWVRALYRPDCTIRSTVDRNSILKAFKTGPVGGAGEPSIRILVLNVGRGASDQTTGLDLGEAEMILSIGGIDNPQQSYSRALRTSATRRGYPLDIVRLA